MKGDDKDAHFNRFNKLLETVKFDEAANMLQNWPKAWLIQFIRSYPKNEPLLRAEAFNNSWASLRGNLYRVNPFQSQLKLSDRELVLGYLYYLLAIQSGKRGKTPQYHQYLNKALDYYSFHAAQTILHDLIKSNDPALPEKLRQWQWLARKHGTPGYLLLATGYYHYLKYNSDNLDKLEASQIDGYLCENLSLAALYEDESETAIYNAYFGKGYILANAYSMDSIDSIKAHYTAHIVDNEIKSSAEQKAYRFFQNTDNNKVNAWLNARANQIGHQLPKM